jgi:hypothetical protein
LEEPGKGSASKESPAAIRIRSRDTRLVQAGRLLRGLGRRRQLLGRLTSSAIVLIAGVATAIVVANPASAATSRITVGAGSSSCPAGYVCVWVLGGYQGSGYGFFNSETNYAALPSPFSNANNNTWSFFNNGHAGSFEDVRMYRDSGQVGDQFVLCRGDAIPDLPANSSLPSNTSFPGRGWQDQVTSHKWGDFC